MAYSTANPPRLISQGIFQSANAEGNNPRMWVYSSTDAVATVRVTNYFTNGYALGMRKNDIVIVVDNDASPITGSMCWVTDVTVGGQADLSDGVTITGTDSD
jgi:hypothetical protein